MKKKQPKLKRGASVKVTGQLVAVAKKCLKVFAFSLSLLVVSSMLFFVYRGVDGFMSKPIERVVVNGEFQRVSKKSVIDEVSPYLGQGFINIDIDGMRQQLIKKPWIYDVSVSRQWPNDIVISVVEQSVIAQWSDNGFINHRGQLFKAVIDSAKEYSKLPLLIGPGGSVDLVMDNYRDLNKLLGSQGFSIDELRLDLRGNWHLVLDERISVVLGSGEVMEKMQRFVSAYQSVLKKDLSRIAQVDMRYRNGFAVEWSDV